MFCQRCGKELPELAIACAYCATRVGNYQPLQPVVMIEPHSRLVYILLAVCLGPLGIHNFYAGRLKFALIELALSLLGSPTVFTPVLVWIFAIGESIAVKTDGKGIPMKFW